MGTAGDAKGAAGHVVGNGGLYECLCVWRYCCRWLKASEVRCGPSVWVVTDRAPP
jgi:hypothetical protein